MRIQHNIMAMNAYRNYTTNTSALSKNLEKLSSGYKINRAGDDAAGLAISEKMRAQITGLDVAQKNAKDGISLVRTAEGALTEVHDMLNRMYELAEQSANGTYQNEVDRDNLQAELDALRDEIDRISQSANFNGIKLFTQGGAGAADEGVTFTPETAQLTNFDVASIDFSKFQGEIKADTDVKMDYTSGTLKITVGSATYTAAPTKAASQMGGTTLTLKKGGTSASDVITVKLASTVSKIGTDKTSAGSNVAAATVGKLSAGAAKATQAAGDTAPTFTADSAGLAAFGVDKADFSGYTGEITADTEVKMAYASSNDRLTITVGSKTFAATLTQSKAALAGGKVTLTNASLGSIVLTMATSSAAIKIGTDATQAVTSTKIGALAPAEDAGGTNEGDVILQIGEDGETYNRLTYTKKGISTNDLGIDKDSINIDTQQNALDALDDIKNAINTVSSIRGELGAIQNRLDHTINNLSVMQENIQDAEATIRDTDVADEMMAYTKNNILVQSAQAMLAQANQVPQGVLQLLQ